MLGGLNQGTIPGRINHRNEVRKGNQPHSFRSWSGSSNSCSSMKARVVLMNPSNVSLSLFIRLKNFFGGSSCFVENRLCNFCLKVRSRSRQPGHVDMASYVALRILVSISSNYLVGPLLSKPGIRSYQPASDSSWRDGSDYQFFLTAKRYYVRTAGRNTLSLYILYVRVNIQRYKCPPNSQ